MTKKKLKECKENNRQQDGTCFLTGRDCINTNGNDCNVVKSYSIRGRAHAPPKRYNDHGYGSPQGLIG